MPVTTILVFGRVQSVGFRFFTQQWAKEHGVNGTVRNCDDGSVCIQTDATGELLEQFLTALKGGMSPYGRVDQLVHYEADDVQEFSHFSILN